MVPFSSSKVQRWSNDAAQFMWRYRVSLVLTVAALIVCLLPGGAEALQFDREQLAAGQWYRLCTCHWTHWNADHAFWDTLMFGLLAIACERRSRMSVLLAIGISVIAISIALWFCAPQLANYRGLSGVDAALFALAGTGLLAGALRDRQWTYLIGGLLLAGGFLGKTWFEIVTGVTFFVDSSSAEFIPVPLAHAIGATIGAAVGTCSAIQFRPQPRLLGASRNAPKQRSDEKPMGSRRPLNCRSKILPDALGVAVRVGFDRRR
jgi:rhomboid family GlyGly-CTERM serine protease